MVTENIKLVHNSCTQHLHMRTAAKAVVPNTCTWEQQGCCTKHLHMGTAGLLFPTLTHARGNSRSVVPNTCAWKQQECKKTTKEMKKTSDMER